MCLLHPEADCLGQGDGELLAHVRDEGVVVAHPLGVEGVAAQVVQPGVVGDHVAVCTGAHDPKEVWEENKKKCKKKKLLQSLIEAHLLLEILQ